MRHMLWGPNGDLDYWAALAAGAVPGPEQRAMGLLRRTLDPYRFGHYAVCGALPCMGNITKRTYLVLKSGGLLEMDDGNPVAWWCFSIGPYAPDLPDTDNVVVVRAMVEGEELAFLNTGDRHDAQGWVYKVQEGTARLPGIVDPWLACQATAAPQAITPRPDKDLATADLLDYENLEKGWAGVFADDYRHQLHPRADLAPVADLRARIAAEVRRELGVVQCGVQAWGQQNAGVGIYAPAAAAPGPRVVRAPYLPEGMGIDMHDGTVLHLEEQACNRLRREHNIDLPAEVERALNEGHPPENVAYLVERIFDLYLGPEGQGGRLLDGAGRQVGMVEDAAPNMVLRPAGNGDYMYL